MLCAVCAKDYYLQPLGCLECSGSPVMTIVAIVVVCAIVLAVLVFWGLDEFLFEAVDAMDSASVSPDSSLDEAIMEMGQSHFDT